MDSLPEELQFRNITSKKKTILEKQQRQVLPSNGTEQVANFTSGPQIVFRVPIDNEWSIQMDSAWIVGNLQCEQLDPLLFVTDAGNAIGNRTDSIIKYLRVNEAVLTTTGGNPIRYPILSQAESWESMISRIAVYLNGSELERIDNYNILESFKHNWCNNANWCNLQAGAMGISQSVLDKSKALLLGAETYPSSTVATNAKSAKIQIAFPLRYLGLMNIKTLLPAYLLGPNSLEIRIWMAPANELFTQGVVTSPVAATAEPFNYNSWTGSALTNLQYRFSDIRMNINYVQTEPSYNNALSQYLISNNLQIPIETYFVTQFPISRGFSGWVNQNISIQYSNINAVYCIFSRGSEVGNVTYLGTDRMHFPEGLSQARLTVNGKVLPSVPIQFTDVGYANQPTVAISAKNTLLTSGVVGVCNNYAPEALTYLMKALGYNTSAEMLGQVNFNRVPTDSITTGGAVYSPTSSSILTSYSGQGMFYASNKAVYQQQCTAANTLNAVHPLDCEETYWKTPTLFALGWSMTRSDYSDEFELSGYNASSNSGIIQVGLNFGNTNSVTSSSITANNAAAVVAQGSKLTPFDDYTCWVIIEHTRVLDIGKDNAQVLY